MGMRGVLDRTWSITRAYARYLLDQRLILVADGVFYGGLFYGRTKDISEGGLGATIAGELNPKEPVQLDFCLPGEETPMRITAAVCYHQGFQYGFKFVGATAEQRAMIREAVLRLPLAP
jgi:hypothetical protein